MRSIIIGLVAGAALLQYQSELLALRYLAAIMAIALLASVFVRRLRSSSIKIPAYVLCGVALGYSWAGLYAQHYLAEELPREWEGRDVTLVGTIDSLPYYFEQGVRFNFAVERVLETGESTPANPTIPSRLALSWYSAFRMDELQAVGKVLPGERWQLTVRLRRPHGNANPHGFDYEVWLLEQNLRATGYVRPDKGSSMKN